MLRNDGELCVKRPTIVVGEYHNDERARQSLFEKLMDLKEMGYQDFYIENYASESSVDEIIQRISWHNSQVQLKVNQYKSILKGDYDKIFSDEISACQTVKKLMPDSSDIEVNALALAMCRYESDVELLHLIKLAKKNRDEY